MTIDALQSARARRALRELCRTHLYDANVSLIDIGFKETRGRLDKENLSLRVHVARKFTPAQLESSLAGRATQPVPPQIGGFATDVIEGRYQPHWWWGGGGVRERRSNTRQSRCDPLQGGISISRRASGAGTLGGIVYDRASGAPMLLSNWHVLAGTWTARPGTAIFQPATRDGAGDAVAAYARHAMNDNLDAAVALLGNGRQRTGGQFELGRVAGITTPALEMPVMKSGRTSGVTRGEVTGVGGVMTLRYAGTTRIVRHIVTLEPLAGQAMISAPGDSGSLYFDATTRACVALHFAGSDHPERALAMAIGPVLRALDVDVAPD